jgi:hypothetical protein
LCFDTLIVAKSLCFVNSFVTILLFTQQSPSIGMVSCM